MSREKCGAGRGGVGAIEAQAGVRLMFGGRYVAVWAGIYRGLQNRPRNLSGGEVAAAWLVTFSTEAATARTLGFGAGFIDGQGSAIEVGPV